jgi:hypothetical protein
MNGLKTMFLPSSTIFSFLILNMNILKKLGMNGACLIGEKDFWKEKKTCPLGYFECFKHIKGLLKDNVFEWNFYH